ncbi:MULTISPECIES: class I SAM-dependent methyltransferase [unclassified Microbacterium]|uniref:class I SAM-dependent methyltransferase n=1 Tax=unclassified Microbacterium TaxID=2609290 RepID=UPI00214CC38C|nr:MULTISPECIES: class I SAM-dependent methyltransferase [unclassified Microbacterium]MCR2809071.1 class I SAM-dependent methyltransferase [Microbacterium sp. zg.B185]WIM20227.1 class I SAM-dependent methyltransferase [Microbacterium sp. zg-B185]
MPDGMHFEGHAEVYGEARPPYPVELWNTVRDLGVLEPGCSAVDLGAGTGQATGPLLAAGMRVTAVEPGPRLAARMRTAYPAATVIQERAETVRLPDRSFDLAVAATSIHWMDLDLVLPRVHRWLRPSGLLLVWRNVFGDPAATLTPFRQRIAQIVAERDAPPRPGNAEDLAEAALALTRTGLFSLESTHTYRWSMELDQRQVHRLFTTFSDWSPEEVERAAAAVADLGGRVVENYASWLIVTRRQERPAQ